MADRMDSANIPPGVYTVAEAAARLGMSTRSLHELIAKGNAPVEPIRIGAFLKFRRVDVERFLDPDAALEVAF